MTQDRSSDQPSDADPTAASRPSDDRPPAGPEQWQQTAPQWDQQAQPPDGQPPYGQPQYGQPQYGQPQYGQPQYGQQPYPGPGYGPPAYAAVGPPTNTMAILALIFGIVVAPLGIVFGLIARGQIKRTGEGGDGLALAGIILGAIFTALFVAYIVFIIVLFSAMAGSISEMPFPTEVAPR